MKNIGIILCTATLLFNVTVKADEMTIDCQDTLSDSHLQLLMSDTNDINPGTVQLIANSAEYPADKVEIEKNESAISAIVVSHAEGTVNFDYKFKNLDVVDCFGAAEPTKEKPTHIEVVAWDTVVSWVQCRCVQQK